MSDTTYVTCYVWKNGKCHEKEVRCDYNAAIPPTIGRIMEETNHYLMAKRGTAKRRRLDGQIVELDNEEIFKVEKNIWIEYGMAAIDEPPFTESPESTTADEEQTSSTFLEAEETPEITAPPRHASPSGNPPASSTDESHVGAIYFCTIDGNEYTFVQAPTYHIWNALNKRPVTALYNTLLRDPVICVKKTNVFQYYNCEKLKAAIVLSKWPEACGNNFPLYAAAQEVFYNDTVKLIYAAYGTNDIPYTELSDATAALYSWLALDFILEWSSSNSVSRLGRAFRTRKSRGRKSCGLTSTVTATKAQKISDYGKINLHDLDKIADDLRKITDPEKIKEKYKSTTIARCQWYDQLNNDPAYEQGIATAVFEKFPTLQTNILLLRHDYQFTMNCKYGHVPDIGEALSKYVPALLLLAKHYKINYKETTDVTYNALLILIALIRQFHKNSKKCNIRKLFLEKENLDVKSMLTEKKTITAAPMVLVTEWETLRTYYIAVDDYALQIHHGNAARALQALFEVHFALNLKYDTDLNMFFGFFEWVSGINKKKVALYTKLQQAFRDVTERQNFSMETNSSTKSTASTTKETTKKSKEDIEVTSNHVRDATDLLQMLNDETEEDSPANVSRDHSRGNTFLASSQSKSSQISTAPERLSSQSPGRPSISRLSIRTPTRNRDNN